METMAWVKGVALALPIVYVFAGFGFALSVYSSSYYKGMKGSVMVIAFFLWPLVLVHWYKQAKAENRKRNAQPR